MTVDGPQESMADFEALIDAQLDAYHKGFEPGHKVTGIVAAIGDDMIALDLNAKCEGIIARGELINAEGELTVAVGDEMTAYFVGMQDGAFLLSRTLAGVAAQQGLREAAERDLPVEGVVKAEINGGYEVTVGDQRAFCPYSQMDIRRQEPETYVGTRLQFLVTEYDAQEHNVVLSRRDLLERERSAERESLRETLAEGDLRDGVVVRVAEFGAFVDLGGIDGLIPMHELTWDRNVKAEDVVREGDHVLVLVQKIDWEKERISLSLRRAEGDPWNGVSSRYPVGTSLRGVVTRLAQFGAFVELEPGVEGLVHISRLGQGRRLQHASEAVAEGDELEVDVESVDPEQRRIGLRLSDARMTELAAGNRVEPGATVTGRVDGHKEFGIFVRLNEEQSGLLHISETTVQSGGNTQGKLERAYPPGSEIDVVVKSVEGKRISLTVPERWEEQHAGDRVQATPDSGGKQTSGGFGSLGDALDGLKLR